MGSLQQQGGGQVNSNRIVSVAETPPPGKEYDEQLQQKPGWKKFLTHVGPGFLVSLAYLDPGNLETDLQAGANHGYEMILSFKLSIVLILLLKFSSTSATMGPQKNSIFIIVFSWALGLGIIGINIYYLTTSMECLIHNSLSKVGNVFIGILVFPLYGSIYYIYNIFDVAKRQSCHAHRADKVQPDCRSPDGKRA